MELLDKGRFTYEPKHPPLSRLAVAAGPFLSGIRSQGVGNIWFAGNNTTQDSEEGALISAMVIAGKVCPQWNYPFVGVSKPDFGAEFWYELMKNEFMFPSTTGTKFAAFSNWLTTQPDLRQSVSDG